MITIIWGGINEGTKGGKNKRNTVTKIGIWVEQEELKMNFVIWEIVALGFA